MQTRLHVRNTIASRKRQVVMRKCKSTIMPYVRCMISSWSDCEIPEVCLSCDWSCIYHALIICQPRLCHSVVHIFVRHASCFWSYVDHASAAWSHAYSYLLDVMHYSHIDQAFFHALIKRRSRLNQFSARSVFFKQLSFSLKFLLKFFISLFSLLFLISDILKHCTLFSHFSNSWFLIVLCYAPGPNTNDTIQTNVKHIFGPTKCVRANQSITLIIELRRMCGDTLLSSAAFSLRFRYFFSFSHLCRFQYA